MKYLFVNVTAGAGSTGQLVLKAARELQAAGNTCLLAYGREAKGCGDVKTLAIGTKLDRGATFLNGEGSYSHEPTKVVLAAVKKQQVTELKELVMAIDPNAFVIVQEAHQVLGDGFSNSSKQSL